MSQTKDLNNVVLNTPSNFNLSIFDVKGNATKHKLIFLIHQINHWTVKDKTCKMYKKAYYETLGLSPNKLNELLNLLIQHGLIEQLSIGYSKEGENGKREFAYSQFRMVEPFKIESSTEHQYYANTKGCPKFINIVVANEWKILPKAKSLFKPVEAAKHLISIDTLPEVIALRKENARLQDMVNALQNAQFQPITIDDSVSTDNDFEDDAIDSDDLLLAEPLTTSTLDLTSLYSVKMNKQFKVQFADNVTPDVEFLDYLSSTVNKMPLMYRTEKYKAFINGDIINIKAA